MRYLVNTSFYQKGSHLCEQKMLPFLIKRIEPVTVNISTSDSNLPDIDYLVTKQELQTILQKYVFIEKILVISLVFLLTLFSVGIIRLFGTVPFLRNLPNSIMFFVHCCSWLIFMTYWAGIYLRIRSRREEWVPILTRSVLLEKLENTAILTGSAIVAQVIVEIEKIRTTQENEIKKSKDYNLINAVLQTETIKTLDDVMNAREDKNKGVNFRKSVFIFLAGYFAEKGLDALLGLKTGNPT